MVAKKTSKPAKKTVKKPVAKKKPVFKTPVAVVEKPVFVEKTDRIIRVDKSGKDRACPKCGAFPTVTKIKRKGYELRRCRACNHVFEIKKGVK